MKLFGKAHIILSIVTFVIVFLMNYLGSNEADKMYRALLNATAGVFGLSIGLFVLYKNRNDKNPPQNFD